MTGSLNLVYFTDSSMNQHSPDKEPFSLSIPRTIKVRLVRMAKARGVSLSELVIEILAAKTANIPISVKDYEAILTATKKAAASGQRLATILDDTP